MQTLRQLQSATLAARSATGMPGIGTRINSGRVQVINATFDKRGTSTIDTLSDWISADDAVEVLHQIAADKAFRA